MSKNFLRESACTMTLVGLEDDGGEIVSTIRFDGDGSDEERLLFAGQLTVAFGRHWPSALEMVGHSWTARWRESDFSDLHIDGV